MLRALLILKLLPVTIKTLLMLKNATLPIRIYGKCGFQSSGKLSLFNYYSLCIMNLSCFPYSLFQMHKEKIVQHTT